MINGNVIQRGTTPYKFLTTAQLTSHEDFERKVGSIIRDEEAKQLYYVVSSIDGSYATTVLEPIIGSTEEPLELDWEPNTLYAAEDRRFATDPDDGLPYLYERIAAGTSSAVFDATEEALWVRGAPRTDETLRGLTDTSVDSVTDNQGLIYNATNSLWEPSLGPVQVFRGRFATFADAKAAPNLRIGHQVWVENGGEQQLGAMFFVISDLTSTPPLDPAIVATAWSGPGFEKSEPGQFDTTQTTFDSSTKTWDATQ